MYFTISIPPLPSHTHTHTLTRDRPSHPLRMVQLFWSVNARDDTVGWHRIGGRIGTCWLCGACIDHLLTIASGAVPLLNAQPHPVHVSRSWSLVRALCVGAIVLFQVRPPAHTHAHTHPHHNHQSVVWINVHTQHLVVSREVPTPSPWQVAQPRRSCCCCTHVSFCDHVNARHPLGTPPPPPPTPPTNPATHVAMVDGRGNECAYPGIW